MKEQVIKFGHPAEHSPRDRLRRPLHDLRISVMDRCNFRCPYCMPEDRFHKQFQFLSSRERLSFDEILRLAQVFRKLGVRKVRVTGGEPLLRPGLTDLIGDLNRIDGFDDLALTTNGVLLGAQAAGLKAAGLDRVTVSLDSLDDEVFRSMSGGRGHKDRVLEGIEEAIAAGLSPIKINAVIKRGVNEHTVLDLVEHFRGTGVIVRFIEFMDVGTINHWRSSDAVPAKELVRMIGDRWPLQPRDRSYQGEVAR
jgi:cyclic pyranopterin phosphate synthase